MRHRRTRIPKIISHRLGLPSAGRSARVKTATTAAVVLLLDLGSKALVSNGYGLGEKHEVLSFFSIAPVHNPGISLALINGGIRLPTYILVTCVLVAVASVVTSGSLRLLWLPLGLFIGGAFGNMLELLYHGYGTDFIYLHGAPGIFNLADFSMILGILLVLLKKPRSAGSLGAEMSAVAAGSTEEGSV
ncbi:MAG: signal peptidase II [Solirubrobacterales bacterium]